MDGGKLVMSCTGSRDTVVVGRVTPGKSSYNAKNALNSMIKYLSHDGIAITLILGLELFWTF